MKARILDARGNVVRLNDSKRTLLEDISVGRAEWIVRELNGYQPQSELAPFSVERY